MDGGNASRSAHDIIIEYEEVRIEGTEISICKSIIQCLRRPSGLFEREWLAQVAPEDINWQRRSHSVLTVKHEAKIKFGRGVGTSDAATKTGDDRWLATKMGWGGAVRIRRVMARIKRHQQSARQDQTEDWHRDWRTGARQNQQR